MKLPRYFLEHPVIAIIVNCMIIVVGLLCYQSLAIREYPKVTFPVISVDSYYPNASSELVESSLTTVLEDQLAGLEGLETITSQSKTGASYITLHFIAGTSMEKALRATQDLVTRSKNRLPAAVLSPIVGEEREESGLPFIALSLESKESDMGALTHYANLNLKNAIQTLPGVSKVDIWGQPYSYILTLDPKKLYTFGVNVDDILSALNRSQIALPAGKFQNRFPTTIHSELNSVNDYENLLLDLPGKPTLPLKSVADIQFSTDTQADRVRINGHTGIVIAITRGQDADPIAVSKAVHAVIPDIQANLPKNMQLHVIIDQSKFINTSIANIRSAIIEAIVLVLLIVLFFLRNLRATLIPLAAIPVSLLGALLFLALFGYSLNLMTILAMVLAVGLVVDDAIVMLENIWRHIENGLSPLEAAKKGSSEIGFAIIAMTLTLASVYAPFAFIQGTLGQLFIEFSVALAGSVLISGVVALILSPLMCATLLGEHPKHFWPSVDRALNQLTDRYGAILQKVLQRPWLLASIVLSCLALSLYFFIKTPNEMAPKEDRGLVGVYVPADAGDSIDLQDKKIQKVENTLGELPEATDKLTFIGDWGSTVFFPLKPHAERHRNSEKIIDEFNKKTSILPSIDSYAWSWDNGLPGTRSSQHSSELEVVISTTESFQNLFATTQTLKSDLTSSKQFANVRNQLQLDALGYAVDIDHNALAKLGLSAEQVAKTIEVFFSGDKSLNFAKDGVLYNVIVRGITSPWTLNELYLTTDSHQPVSLGAIAQLRPQTQPKALQHFNQLRSTTLTLQLLPGESIVQGMKKLNVFLENLPRQYKATWLGAAKNYSQASHQTLFLFLLSIVFIYAILAMQFENFIDPLIILVTVPLAATGSVTATYWCGLSFNIFTEVGLITLIGLISKHGILIVEFANQLQAEGCTLLEAIIRAATLRLRPILMTTGAMIFGALPLLLSHDAGAEPRRAIGLILISGLSIGTVFTLLVLPTVYFTIKTLHARFSTQQTKVVLDA